MCKKHLKLNMQKQHKSLKYLSDCNELNIIMFLTLLKEKYMGDSFFKKIIYFNWRRITLQCCDGFCHTLTLISHGYTCVPLSWTPLPSSLPAPPLWVIPEHRLWLSCFVHRIALAIYFTYGNIHVSMLFSQIIPPWPSPTHSKSLFFTSVSLLLPSI